MFFGREADAARLERHILASACTTLFGPSGSGKSSLVQAAVEPGLQERFGYQVVRVDSWRQDQSPVRSLVQALCTALGRSAPDATADPLASIDEVIAVALESGQRLFVFLDQLEQLMYANRELADLLALLRAVDRIVQHPSQDLHVVLALREDYLGRFRDRARRYRILLENSFRLGPLTVGAMTRAVCQAAAQGKPPQDWASSEVRELMLQMCAQGQVPGDDAEVHGAFVQIVCRALWEQRRAHGAAARLSASNPAEIVERHLQTTLRELGPHGDAALRLLEDKLVDEHQNRTLLTEKEASAALPPGAAAEVLRKLERAAVLRAESYQEGRYFQLGHDWLATQVFARRKSREGAARVARERARRRRRAWTAVAAAVAAVAAITTLTWGQIKHTQEQLRRGQEALLTAAFNAVTPEPLYSVQLGLEVQHGEDEDLRPYTEATLRKGLRGSRFRGLLIASAGTFTDAKFLADGERVATIGAADGLALWEVATGKRLHAMYGDPDPTALALEPAGRLAATAGALGSIDLWDLEHQQLRRTLRGHMAPVTALAFHRDGAVLASASKDGSALVWDAATGSLRHQLVDHVGSVKGLAFSEDGERLVTVGDDRRVVLWDVRRGKKLTELARENDAETPAFSATGRHLAITSGATVVVRDPITQQLEATLSHTNRVSALSFSPAADRIASVGFDGTLRMWSAATGAELSRLTEERVLRQPAIAGGDEDGSSRHWIRTVSFSADGRQLVTVGLDGTAMLWAADDGGEVDAFQAHSQRIRELEYSPSGDRVATASDDGTLAIWDTQGRLVFRTPRARAVRAIAFDPAGARLAAAGGRRVVVWGTTAGAPSMTALREESAEIHDIRIYPHESRNRIAILAGSRVIVRDLEDGREIFALDVATNAVALAVSADLRFIAAECGADVQRAETDRRLCLWSAEDGTRIAVLDPAPHRGHRLQVLQLVFSRDGGRLFSSSEDQTIKVWDVAGRRLQVSLAGHRDSVVGLAASRPGEWLASAGVDRVRLWNVHSQAAEDRFPDAEPGATSVAFSPDGSYLIAGGVDGVVRTYALDPDTVVSIARQRPPFGLSNEDCRRYAKRDCLAAPTPRQIANDERWRRRDIVRSAAGVNRAVSGHVDDAARFESARWIRQATSAIDIRGEDLPAATSASGSSPQRIGVLAATLERRRKGAEDLLRRAGASDATALVDPVRFSTRLVERSLIEMARRRAQDGEVELVESILGVVPGVQHGTDSLHRLASALVTATTISSFRQRLADGKSAAVLAALAAVEPPSSDDPRYRVWLQLAAIAYLEGKQLDHAAKLAEAAIPLVDDPGTLVDMGSILTRCNRPAQAMLAYRRALAIDPAHNPALLRLGFLQDGEKNYEAAVATLRRVSPWAPDYKRAMSLLGYVLYDKLKRPDEGYAAMVIAITSRETHDWANLAEAAWATGQLLEARLLAERVLDARAVAPATPGTQLAMHFVRLAALTQSGELDAAERELDALTRMVADPQHRRAIEEQRWIFDGSREVVSRLPRGALKSFLEALLGHVEHLGGQVGPEQLRALLQQIERTPPGPERAGPAGAASVAPAPGAQREPPVRDESR